MSKDYKTDKYNLPFPKRLRSLIKESGTTMTAVAKEINVTRQAVSQYQDGSTQPNAETIVRIANYFNVSTDYLLGLSDVSSKDLGVRAMCQKTGLCEDSVQMLIRANEIVKIECELYESLYFEYKDRKPLYNIYPAKVIDNIIRCLDVELISVTEELLDIASCNSEESDFECNRDYETIYKKYPDLKEYLETHGFGIISHYENLEEKYSLIRKYFQELAENYIYACLSIEHQTKHIGSFTTIYSNKNLSELKERINKEQK